MSVRIILLWALGLCAAPVFAQGDGPSPSTADLITLFAVAILCVIGIAIYITRDIIMRKKTDYDDGKFESQKNRDFEKYHSDWSSEWVFGKERRDEFAGEMPDYYGILGIKRDATKEQIKKRYRMLAKEMHPDRSGTASEERMAEINSAYEVLSDEERKSAYDAQLG